MEPLYLHTSRRMGWIEVICGSMFSGKTEELIRRLKRARIARQRIQIFKPALDTRYDADEVVSHEGVAIPSTPVHAAAQIILLVGDADVVGIDEAQFFSLELVDVCRRLADEGRRVVAAGLDQDYLARPFEPVPQLMAIAEFVTKLHAVCVRCGAPANHSHRTSAQGARLVVGAGETYEPLCRVCFRDARRAEAAPAGA